LRAAVSTGANCWFSVAIEYDSAVRRTLPSAVFVAAFAVLAAFTAPGLYLRDSGELTTAAFSLGIAHETGFSLYCLVAKLVALVPLGEVALRVNLFSALAGAATAWLLFELVAAVGERDPAAEIAGAGAAALLVAGLTFWKASTVAEVYAPTAAAIALALCLVERAGRDGRAGALLGLVGGLSLGLHAQLRILVGPPVAIWALVRLRRGDRWPLLAPVAVALGAAVVAYLPLRAATDPVADWADPRTLGGLYAHLSATRIRRAFADQILSRELPLVGERLRSFAALVEGQLGVPALCLAAAGIAWLIVTRRTRALGVITIVVLITDIFYSAWINPMGLDDLQDGAPTALVVAVGVGVAIQAAARRLGRAGPWAAGVLAVLVTVPAALTDGPAKAGLGPEASTWVDASLADAPPRALVLTTSDDLSAGALYEQAVAGARPDVTVLVRQQLWDGPMVRSRIARAGGEVHALDGWLARSERERMAREPELLRTLIARELPARAVLWEPAADPSPVAALAPGLPLARVGAPEPLPPVRPLAERALALLAPMRDPLVVRLAATAMGALGRLYLERGDESHAEGLFVAALGLHPGDPVAANNLAVMRARRGDFAGALALLDELLARDPGRAVARTNAGRYRLRLGDLDGAQRDFALARARAPRDPAPLAGLARVALARGDRARAAALVVEAEQLAPGDGEIKALKEDLKK
jgi:tetratricopeptide (TPR) repeat protein